MLNIQQFKRKTTYNLDGNKWCAVTKLIVLCGEEYKEIIFKTEQIEGRIKTHFWVDKSQNQTIFSKEYEGVLCVHPYKRPRLDNIEDSHNASMLDFNENIRKIKEFYYKIPFKSRIQKLIAMHKIQYYMTNL